MSTDEVFVVIGAGHAGGRAVAAMRNEGYIGRIVLIGEEAYLPYERPPLSKEVLADGADPLASIIYDEHFYEENRVETLLGTRVATLDTEKRLVRTEDGAEIQYQKLLFTTGTRARQLNVSGSELMGIHTLRTIDDALALRPMLMPGKKVVLVGGGFIGLEVAASACKLGCEVSVLEAVPRLMSRGVSEPVADFMAQVHRSKGVRLKLGVGLSEFVGTDVVTALRCADGSELEADVAVVGIGAIPNSEIAEAAGISCDNGILVDENCKTSDPNVFAAGDVANQYNARTQNHMRLESWDNAEKQAIVAAKAMCGMENNSVYTPWFWTDQFDINLQVLGYQAQGDTTVMRGDPSENKFCVFTLFENKIVSAALINSGAERRPVTNIIETGREVEASVLADPAFKLRSLMIR